MSDFGWPRRAFLSFVGLQPPPNKDRRPLSVELAEAGVDPRTGGAVSVITKATLDGKGGVTHIKTKYWYMLPSGQQQSQDLFDIELEQGEANIPDANGKMVTIPTIVPRAVWVLGRNVYDAADDGEPAEGLLDNIACVMTAVGDVNKEIRRGKLPQVAQIFKECNVHDAIGEQLAITGLSPKGGFNFDATDTGGAKVSSLPTVPATVARALMGFYINTLDTDHKLRPEIAIQGFDPESGSGFTIEARVTEGKNPQVSASITPTSLSEIKPTRAMINAAWKSDGDGKNSTLEELNLLGEDMTSESQITRMRGMNVINRTLHDLRNINEYPLSGDHLLENDLYHLRKNFEPPPPLSEGGRLTMISLGGNNMQPIAEGFGETIGGNSKVIYHEGLNENGKSDRVGVIVDIGLHLSTKDEPNIAAAPDVTEHLRYCRNILITHRHLDHADGLFAYMQLGLLKGKTVHATKEVIRALRNKLRTYPGIHQDDLPTFSPLKGEGWLHIRDKEGKTRLSVNYARNATPHSARCTPFIVHGHYEGKWIGSYLNPGDARYGSHNSEDYTGPPVDGDHLNKEFFTKPNRRLLTEVPGLDPKIADRSVTYFDLDITSILRQGWGPTEPEVEDNLIEVSNWFKDKGMLLAMISTNDNRFETALRVATRSRRDLTEFGTNLVQTATTMNVGGVNDNIQEPGPRNNIQHYLDDLFEARLLKKIEIHKANLQTASAEEKIEIEEKLTRHNARLEAFKKLRTMSNAFFRYKAREDMERELLTRFGEGKKVTLGSLDEDKVIHSLDEDDMMLGSVRVGRTSETSRKIMNGDNNDGRRLALLTGTQGTNVEVDAALTALAEGRHPVLDGNPKNNHNARPVVPENNVVVISQTAIPTSDGKRSNKEKQDELVRKLVDRGFTVVQALDDGFQIHHIDKVRSDAVLKKLGDKCKKQIDGSLVVTGMPIHAGGHGHQQDCRAWINLVKADVTAAQHSSDPKGNIRHTEICGQVGQRCMGRMVFNGEGISPRAGDSPASTEIRSVGQTLASIISINTVRKKGNYHGGHMKLQRIIRQDGQGGFRSDGLRATTRPGGVYESAFATRESEDDVRNWAARTPSRPEPVPENRTSPVPERLHRGPILPGDDLCHRFFGQNERRSAGFGR